MDGVNLDGLNVKGKRITVVGAGISGRELALMARRLGARVFVQICLCRRLCLRAELLIQRL